MNDTPGWASPGSAPSDPSDGRDDAAIPRPAGPADADESGVKWSKEQPPAGQWSPPTAPAAGDGAPVPPQQQPQQGWGGGWGAPAPAAAKPGVIPLRPLGIGEILDGAVSTLRTHWRPVLAISITVAVISQIATILVQRYLVPTPPDVNPDASPSEAMAQAADSLQSSLLASVPALLITLAATIVSSALLTVVISRSVLGRGVTLADAWQEARPRLLPLLGLTMLLPVFALVTLTIGLVPGLLIGGVGGGLLAALGALAAFLLITWVVFRYSLAPPALMLERRGVVDSLKRSAKLVKGSWWRIFGVQVLMAILSALVTMIIQLPFMFVALLFDGDFISSLMRGDTPEYSWAFLIVTGIGAVIGSAITYPISAGVVVLLYVDQRIRREALDIELARAAGLSGQDPATGAQPAGS
ncbi:glycerophosphoryl diester phosphodiesterase membrane domain-containing protein [Streptomyces sp. NPDC048604]|uniref:glycerophosphoryl diester phosphodiesterase membrane domain-containing protein n=1 Tax=Streptomyces sp. NPDC048604 TaxID=3365578 RepID=UPI0037195C87